MLDIVTVDEVEIRYPLHTGLRLQHRGIITLPNYHSTDAYLKYTTDTLPTGELIYYIDNIYVSPYLRHVGRATRLIHIFCTANDKSPQPRRAALVACPSTNCHTNIVELENYYKARGFYVEEFDLLIRPVGDNRIHKIMNKYAPR